MNHVIITPVYNEEKYICNYIESILSQTVKPKLLVIVDDNSTDNSKLLIKNYSEKHDWIRYVFHSSENLKSQGKKVINAFNFGLNSVDTTNVDIVSKIDADLEFTEDYFEKIIDAFQENPSLGITGGFILERDSENEWKRIPQAKYHIRGALKSYRKTCLKEMGGIKAILGWDGVDEMTALHLGWETKIIEKGVKHYRPAAKDYDPVELSHKLGYSNYMNGGNLFLAIVRSIVKLKQKPRFKIGISYFKGYLKARKNNEQKNVSDELAKFINKHHLKRLFRLKRY